MQCDEARASLVASRYGGEVVSAEAAAHLESCASCRAFAEQEATLDAALATETNEPPGPGFDTRFFARLRAQKERKRWWGLGLGALATATAAILVLALPATRGPAMGEDLELAMNLDMVEELELVARLDDVEAFEVLAALTPEEMDAVVGAEEAQP
jgi:predicted anti-sigma-YlaC factor YlaD